MNLSFVKKHNNLNIYFQFFDTIKVPYFEGDEPDEDSDECEPFNVVVLDMKTNRFEVIGKFITPYTQEVLDELEDVFEEWDS
jgi:hypothetical protein